MPLQSTSGAATYDAFGSAAADRVYIEDVMSTFLYTGNGSTQTITNGIDLSTKGGLVWIKPRSVIGSNRLVDSARGYANQLQSDTTNAQATATPSWSFSASTTGWSINTTNTSVNNSGDTYVSWTFRKQPKFFDVVTYTGNGSTLSVNHALASKPGCIIIKRTDSTSDWLVCTRKSTGNIYAMYLNTTAGQFYDGTEGSLWTSTAVSINWINSNVAAGFNTNGATYVMYLFAHDAGGFGLSGTDNVISCGTWTGTGSNLNVNLGYEPQWLMFKRTDSTGDWVIVDNMRGFTASGADAYLKPNTSDAETNPTGAPAPNSTGFGWSTGSGATFIYIAIRRGPMKVPTSGTSVFSPKGAITLTSGQAVTTGFVTDLAIAKFNGTQEWLLSDRLRNAVLYPNTTDSEGALYGTAGPRPFDVQDGFKTSGITGSYFLWGFKRAPGFFDVVCYTGNGPGTQVISHNLGAAPELSIFKSRSGAGGWTVYYGATQFLRLNETTAGATDGNISPTSTSVTVSSSLGLGFNASGVTYVAYLFATVAGVSKVGSYTGSGTTKQIDCGFTGGARFVLIKRTDTTGNWHLYDSAQGIVAGNDPYLLLNTSDGQYTGTDYVDTYSAGFELSSTAPAGLNANGGTFVFLAVA